MAPLPSLIPPCHTADPWVFMSGSPCCGQLRSLRIVGVSASLKSACLNGPVPHHAGGVAEQAGHRAPPILAARPHQSLLCPAPLRLGVLDELEALLRERDDADALVSAGATADQAVPLQRSKRAGDAGSVHDHVTAKRGDR